MPLQLHLPEMPVADLVALLADPHRSVHAYTRLLTLGPEAATAARGGLAHPDARVRESCRKLLVGHSGCTATRPPATRSPRAAAQDPSPAVRKKASWYAPGGPIYRRITPRPART